MYRFPHEKEEREKWLQVVPAKMDVKNVFAEYDRKKDNKEKAVFPSIVVCRKHWPTEAAMFTHRSKDFSYVNFTII